MSGNVICSTTLFVAFIKATHSITSSDQRNHLCLEYSVIQILGLAGGGAVVHAGEKDDADAFDDGWKLKPERLPQNRSLGAQEAPLNSEVQIYFELPDADMLGDVLKWWPMPEALLLNHSRMARQCLGTPATSTRCERVFGTSGRIFGPENQRMSGEDLFKRMWAKISRP